MELKMTNPMRTLVPHEIAAVGGGPEGTVGTGLNPPVAASQPMRALSTAEIGAVAGGPEGEVGTTVTPPQKNS